MADDPKGRNDGAQTAISERTDDGNKETSDKTLTEAEAQKMVNDALAKAGRDAKSLEDKDTVLTARETALKDQEAAADAAAEAAIDPSDTDGLNAHRARKTARDHAGAIAEEKRKLEEDKEKHQESVKGDLETIRVFNRTQLASEVSAAKGVSIDSILKLAKDDTREAMEEAAKELKAAGGKTLKLDSGRTAGGGGDLSGLKPKEILTKIDNKIRNQ